MDNYRIGSKIGQGGMGHVYRAHHLGLEHDVAIKFMDGSQVGDSTSVERFLREARMLAKLDHPNVVRVFDTGRNEEGTPYIVMELLDGISLSDKLATGAISETEVIEISRQLLSALSLLHDRGIIHRDIKSSNIRLCSGNRTKLLDFGIARNEALSAMTSVGKVVGTPNYMSPEQAEGKNIGPQSDLYSLGIVMYEMLVGAVPFRADTPLTVLRMHTDSPVPALPDRVNPKLRAVVLKALEKSITRRYHSAEEMLKALNAASDSLVKTGNSSSGIRSLGSLMNRKVSDTDTPTHGAPTVIVQRRKEHGSFRVAAIIPLVLMLIGGLWFVLYQLDYLPSSTYDVTDDNWMPDEFKVQKLEYSNSLRRGEEKLIAGKPGIRKITYRTSYLSPDSPKPVQTTIVKHPVQAKLQKGTRAVSICSVCGYKDLSIDAVICQNPNHDTPCSKCGKKSMH